MGELYIWENAPVQQIWKAEAGGKVPVLILAPYFCLSFSLGRAFCMWLCARQHFAAWHKVNWKPLRIPKASVIIVSFTDVRPLQVMTSGEFPVPQCCITSSPLFFDKSMRSLQAKCVPHLHEVKKRKEEKKKVSHPCFHFTSQIENEHGQTLRCLVPHSAGLHCNYVYRHYAERIVEEVRLHTKLIERHD